MTLADFTALLLTVTTFLSCACLYRGWQIRKLSGELVTWATIAGIQARRLDGSSSGVRRHIGADSVVERHFLKAYERASK